MEYPYIFTPRTNKETAETYRGINFIKSETFCNDKSESVAFWCNCQPFNALESVKAWIDTVFFEGADPVASVEHIDII